MQTDAAKELCEHLINADAEADVVALLTQAGYWNDPACWRYYGDNELNWSQAGGQQGRADFALNEKAINSIDAVLTLKCLLEGVNPEGPDAPTSIREAVAKFFEHSAKLTTSGGRVEDWSTRIGQPASGPKLPRTFRSSPPRPQARRLLRSRR